MSSPESNWMDKIHDLEVEAQTDPRILRALGKLAFDRHHILHNKLEHSSRPAGAFIREQPSLIPVIPRIAHVALHAAVPAVPPLGYHILNRTAKLYVPGDNPLQSIDNLSFAIDEASKHPRTHQIERGVADLAIEALQLQKPFLEGARGYGNAA